MVGYVQTNVKNSTIFEDFFSSRFLLDRFQQQLNLSNSDLHQTDLTPVDLWLQPKEVAEFLNA